MKDVAAFDAIIAVARAAGDDALSRLWLCHPDLDVLLDWRSRCDDVRLVNSTRLARLPRGPERRAAELAAGAIDAVNLHHSDWTGGLTTLFHRFERAGLRMGRAARARASRDCCDMGIDGIFSDWVDRMVDAYRSYRHA